MDGPSSALAFIEAFDPRRLSTPWRRLLTVVAALALALPLVCAAASAAEPFRVEAFAGASNLPLWAGQQQGLFARRGLDVTVDITPGSVPMARDLEAGRYDLALTSVDNVVAYDEGEGQAGLGEVYFVALFGVDDGMLSLVAAPSVLSAAALAGRRVSVDAATTGYAFVLRAILARAGLADVPFIQVGGGAKRLAGLLAGQQDATLLNTPLDIVAESHGFRVLARARDELGAYQGIVAAVRRASVTADRARLVAFTAGFHDSVAWVTDPAHRAAVTALLAANMPALTGDALTAAHAALVDPKRGIYRDLRVDMPGLRTVLALRSKYAVPHKELTDPNRYVETSILTAALALR
jgi:ABC-type nitrate/sulfonate/bicarbonate transport system substrate-binding protein